MKKIIVGIILAAALASGFAAKKRIKDHITETKLGSFDEFEIGSGTLKTKKMASSDLSAQDFIVKFNPRKNTASLHYKKLGLKERLIFDVDGRNTLIEAYKAYLADYEAKNLNRKKTKFEPQYGQARMKIDWGAFSYNMTAHPKADFGYIFFGKSPYFAIRVHSIKSEETKDGIAPEYSGAILYFTRAELKDLAEALSEETISKGMQDLVVNYAGDDYLEDNDKTADGEEDYIEK
ncbi:hypothetical protein [Treponema sp.]|uniref:hypothetical protein n=1 Tax=Treponema sp. TaxID=166 RepID=UPI00388E584E